MRFLDKSSKGGNLTFICAHCGNKYHVSQPDNSPTCLDKKVNAFQSATRFTKLRVRRYWQPSTMSLASLLDRYSLALLQKRLVSQFLLCFSAIAYIPMHSISLTCYCMVLLLPETAENDGDQSWKKFKQQELPCILKASSLPPISNVKAEAYQTALLAPPTRSCQGKIHSKASTCAWPKLHLSMLLRSRLHHKT